jgi:hypothetical protein
LQQVTQTHEEIADDDRKSPAVQISQRSRRDLAEKGHDLHRGSHQDELKRSQFDRLDLVDHAYRPDNSSAQRGDNIQHNVDEKGIGPSLLCHRCLLYLPFRGLDCPTCGILGRVSAEGGAIRKPIFGLPRSCGMKRTTVSRPAKREMCVRAYSPPFLRRCGGFTLGYARHSERRVQNSDTSLLLDA